MRTCSVFVLLLLAVEGIRQRKNRKVTKDSADWKEPICEDGQLCSNRYKPCACPSDQYCKWSGKGTTFMPWSYCEPKPACSAGWHNCRECMCEAGKVCTRFDLPNGYPKSFTCT